MADDNDRTSTPADRPSEAANAIVLLRQLITGLAGIAAAVYVAGGAILGLRLAFARLPALGVVGQLPRDVLVAIGASEVLVPALGLVIFHLAWRGTVAMQDNEDRPRRWERAARYPVSRIRHLAFPDAASVLLALPAAVLWLSRADGVDDSWAWWFAAVCLTGVLMSWLAFTLWKRKVKVDPGVKAEPDGDNDGCPDGPEADAGADTDGRHPLRVFDVVVFAAGGVPFVVAAALVALHTGKSQAWWLVAVWFVCMLFAMGYTFARALVGDHFRKSTEKVRPQLAMSCLVAILAVPATVAFWAAWPLPAATVCMKATPVRRTGLLIGETNDRLYFGDAVGRYRAITSVPTANVNRVVYGDVRRKAACGRKRT